MPSYVSNNGVWEPALEKVAITDKNGEPKIYEGPDRAAKAEIKAGNITSQPFWKDTEFINRVRQVHNMSMEEYMKANGFDEKTSQAEFEKKLAVVNLHKDPVKKPASSFRSGGADTSGQGENYSGDFGGIKEAKSKIK